MSIKVKTAPLTTNDTLSQFRALTRKFALFHTLFFSFFIVQLLILLIFLPFLAKSFLLAVVVASTVLTAFAYFVLRFYYQTKKPEQFLFLRDAFVQNIEHLHQPLLPSIDQLLQQLEGQEYQYYSLPASLQSLAPLVQKFSVWCHFDDVLLMKELLHSTAIQTLISKIKNHPTDLELHTALAKAFIAFYKIYQDPSNPGAPLYSFIAKEYSSEQMTQKFHKYAQCALEELKILIHYLPHDRWALAQLGTVYHDLDQKEDERKTYELLLQISPQEQGIRYRLGVLYFQLGFMAQGLKVYDDLRRMNDPKAAELIQYYDQYFL